MSLRRCRFTYVPNVLLLLTISFSYCTKNENRRKDPSITPQETVRNLELICQALKRTGNENKSIYLCTIPTAGDDTYLTEEQMADNLTRNQLIEAYCDKYVSMVQWTFVKCDG